MPFEYGLANKIDHPRNVYLQSVSSHSWTPRSPPSSHPTGIFYLLHTANPTFIGGSRLSCRRGRLLRNVRVRRRVVAVPLEDAARSGQPTAPLALKAAALCANAMEHRSRE
jgi:hypothetical protein